MFILQAQFNYLLYYLSPRKWLTLFSFTLHVPQLKTNYTTCMLDAYKARRCALSGILLDLLIFEVPENKPQYEANTLSILVQSH